MEKEYLKISERVFKVDADRIGFKEEFTDRIKIQIDDDKYFTISMNYEGALVINKSITDDREHAIIIKPSVSNEITIK